MGKYKAPGKNSKFYLSKEDYLTAVHYALRYPQWKGELDALTDTGLGIRYDKVLVQTSPRQDGLEKLAIKRAAISVKIDLIDKIIKQVSKGMDDYIRLSVCYGMTYFQLLEKGIPCSRKLYSEIRGHFYYLLNEKI